MGRPSRLSSWFAVRRSRSSIAGVPGWARRRHQPGCWSRTSKDFAILFSPLRQKVSKCTTHSSSAFRATQDWASDTAAQGRCRWRPADESLDELKSLAEQRSRAGVDCELLDAKARGMLSRSSHRKLAGALLMPPHGFVVAADLSGALSAAAIKHGARVRVPARVTRHRTARRM